MRLQLPGRRCPHVSGRPPLAMLRARPAEDSRVARPGPNGRAFHHRKIHLNESSPPEFTLHSPTLSAMKANRSLLLSIGLLSLTGASIATAGPWIAKAIDDKLGYDDTPFLPGGEWRVHDGTRPQPRIVTPGASSSAPSDATVLFDGTDLSAWQGNKGDAQWTIEDGAMVVNGTGAIRTREEFGDVQLHVEFATPSEVKGNSQGRGNSGVFLLGRYEIQVLDSYDNKSYPDGQASSLYGQYPPQVNACRSPGEWQAYDIFFQAPRFDGDTLLSPALVTVIHNGVLVHHAKEYLGPTRHKQVASYSKHASTGPIQLQDHSNPVRYRNIWVRDIDAK
ncbi:MAG: hypothetical protein ACI841_000683 [Planctomycetota bacterium]